MKEVTKQESSNPQFRQKEDGMGVTGQLHEGESQQEAKSERSEQSEGMLHAEVESAHPTKAALLKILTASYYYIARCSLSFL